MEKRATFASNRTGILLILPQLLLIFTFFYWPAGEALYWAFTLQRPWGGGNEWVGFSNFLSILADPVYWHSIAISILFAVAASAVAMGIALLLALLTDRQLRGYRVYSSVLVWPYAIAAPALGLAFRFMLAPEAGFLATFNKAWPGFWNPALNGTDAMIAIIIAYAWKYIGYNFIFFLAALHSIPRSLLEAGAMDGAGITRRMRDIQLPLLAPTLFFLIIVNLTDYTVGTDRGGEIARFDDFDIDYNQYKYLIETRLSGALTKIRSALVIKKVAAEDVSVSPTPLAFNPDTGVITYAAQTGVVYKRADTDAVVSANITLSPGDELNIYAEPASGYFFPNNVDDNWDYAREA